MRIYFYFLDLNRRDSDTILIYFKTITRPIEMYIRNNSVLYCM